MAFLHFTGRCYAAEICAILVPFRYAFAWYHSSQKSKISICGRKPWTIVRLFFFFVAFLSSPEDAMKYGNYEARIELCVRCLV